MNHVRWTEVVLRIDEWVCALLLVNIVVLLALSVTLRYIFLTAYPWADELVSFSFVWFVYLSMVVAARKSRHFRLELFLLPLPAGLRRVVRSVADLTWFAFNVVVVIQALALVKTMHRFPNRSPMLGWSIEYVYLVIPISFSLTSAWIVVGLVRAWKGESPVR